MEIYKLRKADYLKQQKAAGFDARYAGQIHKNAIAQALGQGITVSTAVLSDYRGFDWSSHPLSRKRTDLKPAPRQPTIGRSSKTTVNFYELGKAILASGMTGIDEEGSKENNLEY